MKEPAVQTLYQRLKEVVLFPNQEKEQLVLRDIKEWTSLFIQADQYYDSKMQIYILKKDPYLSRSLMKKLGCIPLHRLAATDKFSVDDIELLDMLLGSKDFHLNDEDSFFLQATEAALTCGNLEFLELLNARNLLENFTSNLRSRYKTDNLITVFKLSPLFIATLMAFEKFHPNENEIQSILAGVPAPSDKEFDRYLIGRLRLDLMQEMKEHPIRYSCHFDLPLVKAYLLKHYQSLRLNYDNINCNVLTYAIRSKTHFLIKILQETTCFKSLLLMTDEDNKSAFRLAFEQGPDALVIHIIMHYPDILNKSDITAFMKLFNRAQSKSLAWIRAYVLLNDIESLIQYSHDWEFESKEAFADFKRYLSESCLQFRTQSGETMLSLAIATNNQMILDCLEEMPQFRELADIMVDGRHPICLAIRAEEPSWPLIFKLLAMNFKLDRFNNDFLYELLQFSIKDCIDEGDRHIPSLENAIQQNLHYAGHQHFFALQVMQSMEGPCWQDDSVIRPGRDQHALALMNAFKKLYGEDCFYEQEWMDDSIRNWYQDAEAELLERSESSYY